MTLLLVRHARAGRRNAWKGDDRLRPLTKRGRAQADSLVTMLGDRTRTTLISSPWVRCIQTLEPLARATNAEVKVDETLGEGMGPQAWDLYGGSTRGRDVLLCTHGDVVDEFLARLQEAGVKLDALPRAVKGSVWIVEESQAAYLPPPLHG
jgi:8-oxo-dGTP diphosphatase